MSIVTYKDIEGHDTTWWPKNKPKDNASKNHIEACEIIRDIIPGAIIYQECRIPVNECRLFVDIFVPDYNIVFEIDGGQHDKFNIHFHKNKLNFIQHQKRDRLKQDWCDANQLTLVRLKENSKSTWREQIVTGISGTKSE